jgi:hypothetical protein
MIVWCAGATCTPNSHLYRVTCTRCRIDTINSPDDGHITARNMQRIEINIYKKELCVKLIIYKDYTEMHGQQNIKFYNHVSRVEFSERRIVYSIVCFSCYLNFPVNSLCFYKDALSGNKGVIVAKLPSEWSSVSCVLLICLK